VRIRTWFLAAILAACGSFSGTEDGSPVDGGVDAGGGDTAMAGDTGGDGPIQEAAAAADGGPIVIGPPADAACDASRRCIDFEKPSQRVSPFGFDTIQVEVDGGLVVNDKGFGSSFGLSLTALENSLSRGQIKLGAVPPILRIRMKVRADFRDADATSDHFLSLNCEGDGDNLSLKFSLNGEMNVQAGQGGKPFGTYTEGTWVAIDATAVYSATTRTLTATRLDTNVTNTVSVVRACLPPLTIRVQSSLTGGPETGTFSLSVDDIGLDWN
jgi:hypothetical protein